MIVSKENVFCDIWNIDSLYDCICLSKEDELALKLYKIHKFDFECDYGPTNEIPCVGTKAITHLDDNGIVKKGIFINGGSVLVGNIKIKPEEEFSTEDKMLMEIFKNEPIYKDASLYLPKDISGVVKEVIIDKYYKKHITVYIEEEFPLQTGDILQDETGKEMIYCGSSLKNLSNSEKNIQKIKKKRIIRSLDGCSALFLKSRSVGKYLLYHTGFALCNEGFFNPQSISLGDIKKFINCGRLDILQNLLLNTVSITRRRALYKDIIDLGDSKFHGDCNYDWIKYLKTYLLVAGIRMNFVSTYRNQNMNETIQSEDCQIRIMPTTDEFIDQISKGESIEKNWDIYNKQKHENDKSSAYSEEYKFIDLEFKYANVFFQTVTNSKILVMPYSDRKNYNKNIINPINWGYKDIISAKVHKDRVKCVTEDSTRLGQLEKIERATLMSFFCNNNDKKTNQYYKGIICDIYDFIRAAFTKMALDYSASTKTIIVENIKTGSCKIPYKVAVEMFNPFICNAIMENKKVLLKSALDLLESGGTDIEEFVKELFDKRTIRARMFCMSENENGQIIELIPQISSNNITELSKEDYDKLAMNTKDVLKMFVLPQGTQLESDKYFLKISEKRKETFFEFLNILYDYDKTNSDKLNVLYEWLKETINDKDIVNSVGFCLLTGRNVYNAQFESFIQ